MDNTYAIVGLASVSTRKRSDDWMAFVTGNTAVWESGKNEHEAIGKLITRLNNERKGQ